MTKKTHFKVSPSRRSRLARLTPLAWLTIVVVGALLVLALYAGGRWLARQWPLWFATEETVLETPVAPAAPTATPIPVATEVSGYPAYWADTMVQDAQGDWWPAEEHREEVQALVEAHYREMTEAMEGPHDQVLQNPQEIIARYLGSILLESFAASQEIYREDGDFLHNTLVVTERLVTVQNFSPDGLTCQVGDTYVRVDRLDFDSETETWQRTPVPEDGVVDDVQYLGVVVYEMRYDAEDGRWKAHEFIKWIPRPASTGDSGS